MDLGCISCHCEVVGRITCGCRKAESSNKYIGQIIRAKIQREQGENYAVGQPIQFTLVLWLAIVVSIITKTCRMKETVRLLQTNLNTVGVHQYANIPES